MMMNEIGAPKQYDYIMKVNSIRAFFSPSKRRRITIEANVSCCPLGELYLCYVGEAVKSLGP